MAKATWVNVNGNWKQVKNVWTKINGTWKQKVIPKGKISNVWKEFIAYKPQLRWVSSDDYWSSLNYFSFPGQNSFIITPSGYIEILDLQKSVIKTIDSKTGNILYSNKIYFGYNTETGEYLTTDRNRPTTYTRGEGAEYAIGTEKRSGEGAIVYYYHKKDIICRKNINYSTVVFINITDNKVMYTLKEGLLVFTREGKKILQVASLCYFSNMVEAPDGSVYCIEEENSSGYIYKFGLQEGTEYMREVFRRDIKVPRGLLILEDGFMYAYNMEIVKKIDFRGEVIWEKKFPMKINYVRKHKDKYVAVASEGDVIIYDKDFEIIKEWTTEKLPFLGTIYDGVSRGFWNIDDEGNLYSLNKDKKAYKVSGLLEV